MALEGISLLVLIFVLRIFLCLNLECNACASVWLCFYPFTLQRTILRVLRYLLRGLPDYGTYDVPKHVGDLLTSDVYVILCT